MAAIVTAQIRDGKTCSSMNRLRRSGRIPGVLYGANRANQNIHVDQSEFCQALKQHGKSAIFKLQVEGGETANVMIAEIQRNDLDGRIIHLDFKRVNMNKPVTVTVPVTLIGEAEGAKQGGILQFQTRELEMRCMPSQVPNFIPLYVGELKIGESLTVADLDVAEGIEVQHEPDKVIVSMVAPRMQPVAADEGTEEIAEPEVVGAKDGPGLDEAK